jgi:transcriptional regulator NrdR family protein
MLELMLAGIVPSTNSGVYKEDPYESSEEEKAITAEKRRIAALKNQSVKRSKECPGCGSMVTMATRECSQCDYKFTSKTSLSNQQTQVQESQGIRDRFPFEPEKVAALSYFCNNS